jgi:hypothetical protein
MKQVDQPTWQLLLNAAKILDAKVGCFRLGELIKEVQRIDPSRGRTSIQPTVQGMTANAGTGPPSPCGTPFVRVDHGLYRLASEATETELQSPSQSKSKILSASSRTETTQSKSAFAVQNETELVGPDLILVTCVKTKRAEAATAKDLYISPLFCKERAYAERHGVPWYILSAEHGLVDPEQWLAPYERYLPDESSAYRRAWGIGVASDLEHVEGSLDGKVIEIHASAAYIAAVRLNLQSLGAVVTDPLHGLSQGKRLQWYNRTLLRESQE